MSYTVDREWSDRFIPAAKRIIGPELLDVAPLEVDCTQATDLIVLTAGTKNIGVRIRSYGFAERYPNQFTIRSHRDSGAKTELAKIIDGWGDWFFYGYEAADPSTDISPWMLLDLRAFRAGLVRELAEVVRHLERQPPRPPRKNPLVWGKKDNNDGTQFRFYDVTSFPAHPPTIVASSHPIRVAV